MRRVRVLIADAGADDGAAKLVARALSDAGHEVVYAGGGQTAAMIEATAMQESVDAIVCRGSDVRLDGVPIHAMSSPADIVAWLEQVVDVRAA